MKTSTKTTLWKIYFWIILINGIFVYLWQSFSRFWEIADLIIFSVAIIGLFAFAWKKTIFSRIFWKTYFFIHIIWNVFYLYILPLPEKITETMEISQFTLSTITVVFYIPLLFALYSYAFKSDEKIKK